MIVDGSTIVTAVLVGYFLPTVVGALRQHHAFGWLFAFNLGCGWMWYCWLGALIWAIGGPRKRENTVDALTGPVEYIPDPEPDDGERIPTLKSPRSGRRHRFRRGIPMKLKKTPINAER